MKWTPQNVAVVRQIMCNFPDVQKQLDELPNIVSIYFEYAYGVTPALFVLYQKDGDEFLERIRLEK